MANINGVSANHIPNALRQERRAESTGNDEKRAVDESMRKREIDKSMRERADELERLRAAREVLLQKVRQAAHDVEKREAHEREREALDEKIREQGASVVDVRV